MKAVTVHNRPPVIIFSYTKLLIIFKIRWFCIGLVFVLPMLKYSGRICLGGLQELILLMVALMARIPYVVSIGIFDHRKARRANRSDYHQPRARCCAPDWKKEELSNRKCTASTEGPDDERGCFKSLLAVARPWRSFAMWVTGAMCVTRSGVNYKYLMVTYPRPPKWAGTLIQRLVPEHLAEEIKGGI